MPDKKLSYLESMQKHFETYSKTKEYTVHSAKVHSVDWSCNGNRLASGSFDKTCWLFTVDKDRLVCDLTLKNNTLASTFIIIRLRTNRLEVTMPVLINYVGIRLILII